MTQKSAFCDTLGKSTPCKQRGTHGLQALEENKSADKAFCSKLKEEEEREEEDVEEKEEEVEEEVVEEESGRMMRRTGGGGGGATEVPRI